MSESTIIDEAQELVNDAKKPGTFSIINVLKERAYPKDNVTIFLDEQAAYDASELQEKIDELNKKDSSTLKEEIELLTAKRDLLVANINSNKYIFTIVGISEGMREDILLEAAKKFPIEYDEEKSIFSGETIKKEKENKDRDKLFTNLLWHAQIEKIEAPDGSVQEAISLEDVAELRRQLPIAAIGKIATAIEKVRVATAMFMISVEEDFLAKS